MAGSSSGGIFLSYRREDAAPYARLLQYQLSERFPHARVFMDLDSIEAGLDFAEVIRDAVGSSAVLVDNARPLRQQQLPAGLHKLARLNALELSYGRYQYDSGRLLDLVQRVLAAAGDLAEPPRQLADTRPSAGPSGPRALAITLTHGSRWLTVYAVAFSPDGHLLASGLEDAGTQLWDAGTGQWLHTLSPDATFWSEMTGPVHAVAFSPDGRLLASASEDKTVRLWNPATGQHERTLTGHARGVWGVAFSPDGRLLASASEDKTVRLWDPATGQHERTLAGHAGPVRSVAFSPDGRLLASAGDDGTVRLWR